MTFKSTLHHFFDHHAKALSHKTFFQNWCTEVTGAPDRPVDKVELCTGVTFKDVTTDGWDFTPEAYDAHTFLQVYLAETAHHPRQVVLIERIKGGDEEWPHSAIPLPGDRIQSLGTVSYEPDSIDIACVLKHGSHGTDVVYELEVERTLEVNGNLSVHEFVSVLESTEELRAIRPALGIDCEDLARSFASDTLRALAHRMHHRG